MPSSLFCISSSISVDFDALDTNSNVAKALSGKSPVPSLEDLAPRFFIPHLLDTPQNPIIDALRLTEQSHISRRIKFSPDLHFDEGTAGKADADSRDNFHTEALSFWQKVLAIMSFILLQAKVFFWDQLRPSHKEPNAPAFLSENDDFVYASARYHVLPPLRNPDIETTYVSQNKILPCLRTLSIGVSSPLFEWNPESETFKSTFKGKRRVFYIDGRDAVLSKCLIRRFAAIGTHMRRLETYISSVSDSSCRLGATVNAFCSSLSSIHSFLRTAIFKLGRPLTEESQHTLSAISVQYQEFEELLNVLLDCVGRAGCRKPSEYDQLEMSPRSLLTRIFDHLNHQIESQAPVLVRSLLSFILTRTSVNYFHQIARAIGFSRDVGAQVVPQMSQQQPIDDDGSDESIVEVKDGERDFPKFFPSHIAEKLSTAEKSLAILRTADPQHSMLVVPSERRLRWFWTEDEVDATITGDYSHSVVANSQQTSAPTYVGLYLPQLSKFDVYDLEPGQTIGMHLPTTSSEDLEAFISTYPMSLPCMTPTLAHLSALVLDPLIRHANALSSALLDVLLTSHTLNCRTHLLLLRSYLLMTAEPFRRRISAALMSDNCSPESLRSGFNNYPMHVLASEEHTLLAVGLAPRLLARGNWPPVDGDLSFLLRTVIIDSFDSIWQSLRPDMITDNEEYMREQVENRFGFAIRDASPKTKWMDPLGAKPRALDFLYMDYKPPDALKVIITQETIGKYQRVFAFILRLMRVENALAAVARLTSRASNSLLPTFSQKQRRLLHFRFISNTLVSALMTHVFDTAIRGNFDVFLKKLDAGIHDRDKGFSDVFALGKAHSVMMDDILSACLLRSGQRAVADLLRQLLTLVLDFANLCGEINAKRIEEYQAVLRLDDLYIYFRSKMMTLTKVLQGFANKDLVAALDFQIQGLGDRSKPVGGVEALTHLLLRLDLGNWWNTRVENS
ncbi:hypothetical protein FISHEDRAFT_33969 [Fistulina hepatica ATCC 64428]|uniref:Spindle pole body component n=1 Tax=Fistulina hepatica ATCC 64428 TaxID=1128425 RepID=A0A0D7AQL7_9AGAR|nr:hypothetical protein FISHEDRAFT_33969 [Fistulina hepatica ATCC 64428]